MEKQYGKLILGGTAITYGYSVPYETADFSGDFWLRCR